jgi:branched-chain amino acid transport system substrate-binding protein
MKATALLGSVRMWTVLAMALVIGTAAHAQTRTVKIGVLTDMSSVAVDEMGPGSLLAAQMAAEDMGGSVAGMKIEVIAGDHQQKPDVGASIARRWFDQEGVDAIVDVPNSSIGLAINQIARDANKVLMPASSQTMALVQAQCSPNTVRWTTDTWVTSHTLPNALVRPDSGKTWFFLHTDNAYGRDLTQNATAAVQQLGGRVVGVVPHPVGIADFSSFVVQARSSGAEVIGLATYSTDLTAFLKQAGEFGLMKAGGPKMAGFVLSVTNIRAAGLELTQGLYTATPFYWDLNDDTRAFAKRFNPRHPRKISLNEFTAGVYSSTLHYLKAVKEVGSAADGRAVVKKMKEIPVDDPLSGKGKVRADGSVLHNIYLMQVKAPSESKGEWDYLKLISTLSGEQAFAPLDKSCPLVSQ